MRGIDISNWQPDINISSVPADFVIIKTTGGAGFINRHMSDQLAQSRAAGRKVGLYHFARDGWTHTTPEQEARHFLNRVTAHLGDVVLVLDWEADNVHDVDWAARWLDIVTEATGTHPLIYMTLSTANSYDWSAVAKHHPLWLAWYWDNGIIYGHQDRAAPGVNHWGIPAIWQYTQHGKLPGYAGDLDLNIAYTDPWAKPGGSMVFTRHPVDSYISQPWGANKTGGITPDPNGTDMQKLVYNYGNYQPFGHDGIDYGCPIGTPVYAPGNGTVEYAGWGQNMPKHIADKYGFIYGPGGWPSGIVVCMQMDGAPIGCYMAHLSEWRVNAGQRVGPSVIVGLSGNSGRSGGPHCHFSAIRFPVNYSDGLYSRVNPLPLFSTVTQVQIRPGGTGDPATPEQEWYLMPKIPTDNLLQIVTALKSKDFGSWIQAQVAATPIKSTDGKLWPLRSHLYGITQRQQHLARDLAAQGEVLRQVMEANGSTIDYTKVEAAAERGAAKADQLSADAIAEATADKFAERLTPKESA